MATVATATFQPVWDCRWSSPGAHITGVDEALQPETRWVCTHDGTRRSIDPSECESCARWEAADGAVARMVPATLAAPRALPAVKGADALRIAVRAVMLLTAALFVVFGVTVITAPLYIPVAILSWLTAAAIGAYGLVGRFDED